MLTPDIRRRDHFLEYLRKHFSGQRIQRISTYDLDRIIKFETIHGGDFYFFYKGRDLLFGHFKNGKSQFLSWTKQKFDSVEASFKILDNSKISVRMNESSKRLSDAESVDDIETLCLRIQKEIEKERSDLKRKNNQFSKKMNIKQNKKLERIKKDLDKLYTYKNLMEYASSLDDASKLPNPLVRNGVKIKFYTKEHFKRRDEIFKKAKALKRAIPLQERRLALVRKSIDSISQKNERYSFELDMIKVIWSLNNKSEKPSDLIQKSTASDDIKILQFDQLVVGIGKNSKGNHYLVSKWGKKDDIWLHQDQQASEHILIRGLTSLNSIVDIQDELRKLYKEEVGITKGEVNLIYTFLKNVKTIKGSTGLVKFTKEKRLRILL